MRKLNKLLAGVSVAVLASFNTQASCVPANCNTLGYTKSASDCEGADMIKCPFDTNQVWCVEPKCQEIDPVVGAIYNSDGTFMDADCIIKDKTPIGVVAYVEGSTRFAVALEETKATWGGYGYDVSCLTNMSSSQAQSDFNGAANTQCLINDSRSHPAAEYCNTYKPVSSGTGSSGWYLPAAGELYVMSFSYGAINLGLQKLSKKQLQSAWSSSESNNYGYGAWVVRPSDGDMSSHAKTPNSNSVRCVLAF